MLDQFGIIGIPFVQSFIFIESAEILAETVANQLKIASHLIDDRSQTRKTGPDDRLIVLQDQLDGVLLQLGQERFTGVFQQRDDHLQSAGHGADDLVVARRFAAQAQIRLKGHGVRHEQLGTDFGEQVQSGETGHQTLRSSFASSAASCAASAVRVLHLRRLTFARVLG